MPKSSPDLIVQDEMILSKIYLIRDQKIMLDYDLAELYGVETKRLKEAVRRNFSRFPEDFMFELFEDEWTSLRTQFASLKSGQGKHTKYLPFAFTEQGVTMLSCVLNSERAISVNIQIIRIFIRMRQMLFAQKDILLQLEKIERKLTTHDEDIHLIFQYIKQLLTPAQPPRNRIGFKNYDENA